jgi:hypothetical protein
MGVRCSDPITHPLHRKWLGRGEHRPSDTQAAWLRFDDITVNRHEDPSTDTGFVRILRSQALDIRLLLHEIPSPLTTYTPSGLEPATGFVACEATLQNFEATETLDNLRRRLGRSPKSKPTQAPHSESKTPLRNLTKNRLRCRTRRGPLPNPLRRSYIRTGRWDRPSTWKRPTSTCKQISIK